MSISRRDALRVTAASLPLSALALGVAHAQAPAANNAQVAKDPLLAGCLLIGGRKQIENCRFALEKLSSDDAKAFAKAEIEEHESVKADLERLGYSYPVRAGNAANAQLNNAAGNANAANAYVVTAGPTPLSPDAANLVVLDHEVAEQCIQNFRKEMGELDGVKLDKRFVGNQLDAHLMLKDKVQVFQRHASPAMRPSLDKGLQTIETHIATLKGLMDKLDQRQNERRDG